MDLYFPYPANDLDGAEEGYEASHKDRYHRHRLDNLLHHFCRFRVREEVQFPNLTNNNDIVSFNLHYM